METLTTKITTTQPERVMRRLCKHWAHKIAVEYDEHKGKALFPEQGEVHFTVEENSLVIRIEANNSESMQSIQKNIEHHMVPMAQPEIITISWP